MAQPVTNSFIFPVNPVTDECLKEGKKITGVVLDFTSTASPQAGIIVPPFVINSSNVIVANPATEYIGFQFDPTIYSNGQHALSQVCAISYDWQMGKVASGDSPNPIYMYNLATQQLVTLAYEIGGYFTSGAFNVWPYLRGCFPFYTRPGDQVQIIMANAQTQNEGGILRLFFANFDQPAYATSGSFVTASVIP